jgi:hypothetical protein
MISIRKNENDIAKAMESLVVRSSLNAITSAKGLWEGRKISLQQGEKHTAMRIPNTIQ